MTLGGVDIYLTNITTVYLPAYGLPVLLSLTVYVLTMSFFKMWIVDREVLVLPPRHNTPRNEQPLNRASLRPRRSNRSRTNRRRTHLVERTSINVEADLVERTSINVEAELVESTSINFEAELVERTSINFEAELDKPYGKALKEIYSNEQIKRALVYMNQKGK